MIALLVPISLLVSLLRVYPPRTASTSAKQRILVAYVGMAEKYLTVLALPRQDVGMVIAEDKCVGACEGWTEQEEARGAGVGGQRGLRHGAR